MNHPVVKISDLCTIKARIGWQGLTKKEYLIKGDYYLITGVDFTPDHKINFDNCFYVSRDRYEQDSNIQIHKNDILLTKDGTLGKVALIDLEPEKPTTLNGGVFVIRVNDDRLYLRYLMYYFLSNLFTDFIQRVKSGSTVPHLTQNKLVELEIPLPSLSEQKKIVAVLDEVFARLDKAKVNVEKNLKNVEELFQSKLMSYNFPVEELGCLVNIKTGKLDANAAVENGEYPFFTCSRDVFRIDNYAYDCEAILLAGNNASGDFNVKYYNGKFNAYQRTYILTAKDESSLDYRFLYYQMLKSLAGLKKEAVGTNTKFLRLPMIKSFKIHFPGIDEQKRFVQEMDFIDGKTKVLKENYLHQLDSIEELRKSVLEKAFKGELI